MSDKPERRRFNGSSPNVQRYFHGSDPRWVRSHPTEPKRVVSTNRPTSEGKEHAK